LGASQFCKFALQILPRAGLDLSRLERLFLWKGAIADLLKEKEVKDYGTYGGTKKVSIISEAFDLAAQRVAGEVIREEVAKSEEFRNAVRVVMQKAIDAILPDEKIGESAALLITNLITKALESYRD